MNKMKKALLLALSLAMSATLFAACGKDKGNGGNTSSSSAAGSEVSTPVESESSEESSSETESSSEAPVESESSEESSSEPEIVKYTFTKIIGNRMEPGGMVMEELEEGATLDLAEPEKAGKNFLGWVDGEGNPFTGTQMPADHLTVYANWELIEYTVTIKEDGKDDVTLKFAVESDWMKPELYDLYSIAGAVEEALPVENYYTEYTVTGIPETWELQDYTIEITSKIVDDKDLAGTITLFDRLNKKVLMADGKVKENKDNYWDGTLGSVTATTQSDVVNGSDFARKITINYNNLTDEEKAAGNTAYGGGWAGQMWVGFAVPVGGVDLNSYELVFDMKLEGMSSTISAYSARTHTGDLGADYEFGAEGRYSQNDCAEDLGNGWYRWTIAISGELAVDKAADWIILSIDNCVDPSKEAVGYIDNVSLNEVIYHTVTVDGEEQKVREGTQFTVADPEKAGWKFLGWVDGESNPITLPITVTADCVINSTWELAPIELSMGENNVVLPEVDDEYASDAIFTGAAGKYTIVTTGIKAINKETQEVITGFELTEDGSFTFTLVEGDDWETEGTVKILKEYVPEIPATARKVLNSALKANSVSAAEDVVAPKGYTSAMKFTGDWSGDFIHMGTMGDKSSLTNYTDIFFAIKMVNGKSINVGGEHYTGSAWLYMHYVQTAATTWTLYVNAEDSSFEKTIVGIDTTENGANYPLDALSTLMFKGSTDVCVTPYRENEDTSAAFYTTEVVGVTKPFQHGVPETATIATASIFAGEKGVAADATVPAGFTSVSKYASAWAEGGALHLGTEIDKTDLSEYSDIYFAMRVENATLTVYDGVVYEGSGWVYIHYTQTAEATWTANIRSDDGTLNLTKVGIDATAGSAAYPLNAISTLLYKGAAAVNFFVKNNAGSNAGILYSTEVRGVKKA